MSGELLLERVEPIRLPLQRRLDRRRQALSRLDRIGRELVSRCSVREYTVAHVPQDDQRVTFCAGIVLDAGPGDCVVSIGGERSGQNALKLLEQGKNVAGRVHRQLDGAMGSTNLPRVTSVRMQLLCTDEDLPST